MDEILKFINIFLDKISKNIKVFFIKNYFPV